jgi:hypothetical protein
MKYTFVRKSCIGEKYTEALFEANKERGLEECAGRRQYVH